MTSITIEVSDELARKLAAEAARRSLTIEQVACERVSMLEGPGGAKPLNDLVRINYLKLAKEASDAPSARKSSVVIDGDVEASRQEW